MDELTDIFLAEALGHQVVLDDETRTADDRRRAAGAIEIAARLAGQSAIADIAGSLEKLLARPSESEASVVADYRERLARALHLVAAGPPLEATGDQGLALTGDEMGALWSIFRDEMSSLFEGVVAVLSDPTTPPAEAIEEVMRTAHSIKGSAATVGMTSLAEAAHRFEDHLEPLGRSASSAHLERVLACIDALRGIAMASPEEIGLAEMRMDHCLRELPGTVAPAGKTTRHGRRRPSTIQVATDAGRPVIRVDAGRVDAILDELGTLIVEHGRIDRHIADLVGSSPAHNHLAADAQAMGQTIERLRQSLTELRMQTARALFERISPAIRGAARDAGKRIRIEMEGSDTRFDRVVAEAIADPLVHLLRNAIAHGIESPTRRVAADKAEEGTVTLRAQQRSDGFTLEVRDDGAGIDARDLRRRLVEGGQWSDVRAKLASDEEVLATIFDPGTTSRDRVDDLAGRGVGLDAVRATVTRLGGEIEVTSTPKVGTTFALRLPMTTAVTRAHLFEVGAQVLAVPSSAVLGQESVTAGEVRQGRCASGLAVISAHELLGLPPSAAPQGLLVGFDDRRIVVACDAVRGSEEIVVKALGPLLRQLPLSSGATITGTGTVVFILDPVALVHRAHPRRQAEHNRSTTATISAAPARVLIVDDSRTSREAMAAILERAGFSVEVAEDGKRAWDRLTSADYDALVTDIEMPAMSGLELGSRVRRSEELCELPIVIVTSRTDAETREGARALDIAEVLTKPVPATQLVAAVRRELRR